MTAAQTIIFEDLASVTETSLDRVRARLGAENCASVTTTVQDSIETSRVRLAAGVDWAL